MERNGVIDPHPVIMPIADFEAAKARFRAYFNGYEHWMLVFDPTTLSVLDEAVRRYYPGLWNTSDLDGFQILDDDQSYIFAAARKRMMRAHQFGTILRRHGGPNFKEEEIISRDVQICTQKRLIERALYLAVAVLRKPGVGPVDIRGVPINGYVN